LIADLHIHYAMHLISDPDEDLTLREMVNPRYRRRIRDWIRALVLNVVSRLFNYRSWSSGHRVDIEKMAAGRVRVGFSVLYLPLTEFQIANWDGPPQSEYVGLIEQQLAEVEAAAAAEGAVVAKDRPTLEDAIAAEKVALIHCIEGGYQLGANADEIRATVARFAQAGVVYVTLAHLFWRQVATNSNAFPFLTDRQYHFLFHEPDVGLTPLGEAALEAMVEHHVLADLSHMSDQAIRATFDVLARIEGDRGRVTPVIATHSGARQESEPLDYNLSRESVEEIAARCGVIGLISGDHLMGAGILPEPKRGDRRTRSLEQSLDVLFKHVDTLHEWCGGTYEHIGIGSDLDGFIKPTLKGIESATDLGEIERAFSDRYGPENAQLICSGNALRLLRGYWRPPATN
jgi:microsomal dipeptidase-like Zn-dependent dipeptidase